MIIKIPCSIIRILSFKCYFWPQIHSRKFHSAVPPVVFTVNNPPVNGVPLIPTGLLVIVIVVVVLETSVGALAVPGEVPTAVEVVIGVDVLVAPAPYMLNTVAVILYRVDEFRPEIVSL
jgi:hypothetical protein